MRLIRIPPTVAAARNFEIASTLPVEAPPSGAPHVILGNIHPNLGFFYVDQLAPDVASNLQIGGAFSRTVGIAPTDIFIPEGLLNSPQAV